MPTVEGAQLPGCPRRRVDGVRRRVALVASLVVVVILAASRTRRRRRSGSSEQVDLHGSRRPPVQAGARAPAGPSREDRRHRRTPLRPEADEVQDLRAGGEGQLRDQDRVHQDRRERRASSQTTYSDGTVTYTATNGASLGVTGGFGGKMDIGEVERGAKVDFGAGFKVDYGSTWVFEDQDEADSMREQLDEYLVRAGDAPARHLRRLRHRDSGSPAASSTRPSRPARRQQHHVEGEVSGKVGLSLPFDPADKNLPDDQKSGVPEPEAGRGRDQVRRQPEVDPDQRHRVRQHHLDHDRRGLHPGQRRHRRPAGRQLKGVQGSSLAITRNAEGRDRQGRPGDHP